MNIIIVTIPIFVKFGKVHNHEKQVIFDRSKKNTTSILTSSLYTFFTIIPKGTSKMNMVSMVGEI